MNINKEFIIVAIGYILAIFFSIFGLIYGTVLYFLKKNNEILFEHSKNIMGIAAIFIVLRLFISLGSMIF